MDDGFSELATLLWIASGFPIICPANRLWHFDPVRHMAKSSQGDRMQRPLELVLVFTLRRGGCSYCRRICDASRMFLEIR